MINPGSVQSVSLAFTVASNNADLDPNNDAVTTSLIVSDSTETDAPLPLWALGALAASLFGIARRRLAWPV